MDSFVYSLNATIPIFLVMVLGGVIKKLGVIDDHFAKKANKYVFDVALPVMLFRDIASADMTSQFDAKFVFYCMFVTIFMFVAIWVLTEIFMKDDTMKGSFVQGSCRSSAAILGMAFIQNMYSDTGMAPLMIIGSVPLYNIMAVTTLSLFAPGGGKLDTAKLIKTLKGIATNPIILGILTGMIWSLLHFPMPAILETSVNNLGKTATPLGLMAMGGALKFGKAFARPKPLIACTFLKLAGYEAVFLPIAVMLGFSHDMLVAIIIMLGSATTVSCYIMAKNMGNDEVLTSNAIVLSTMFSSVTMTGWIYLLRSLGLI